MSQIITDAELNDLRAADAKVARAGQAKSKAEAKHEAAKAERKKVWAKLADRVPFNDNAESSDVTPVAEGLGVRRLQVSSGERVDLKAYRKEHRISPVLKRFIVSSSYETWALVELDADD